MESFEKAYANSDLVRLRKYIKLDKILSTKKFMNYVEESFKINREVYDILVLVLLNQYDLNEVVIDIIVRDNIDLMESIFSYNTDLVLDYEKLIPLAVPKGRISMAKMIYEYNHGNEDSYDIVIMLLEKYEFIINKNEKSIDSFVVALYNGCDSRVKKTLPYINPDFWDNFSIKIAMREYGVNRSNIKKLLLHSAVDPGVDNNYQLKNAIKKGNYYKANELLKHPLVAIDNINRNFIMYLIKNNCLCVSERILRSNNDVIIIFKEMPIIDLLIECHNDVTYIAIKLGIFDVVQLINFYPEQKRKIKKYLRNFEMDDMYVCKPYEFNLESHQIFEEAIEYDDMDLAKSICNYPISIGIDRLFDHLKYSKFGCKTKSVSSYIWNEILKEYDPNKIVEEVLYRVYRGYDKKWVTNAFNLIYYFGLKINYAYVWKECCNDFMRKIMWENMEQFCTVDECGKIISDIADEKLDNYHEGLSDDKKMAILNDYINLIIKWRY